MSGNLNISPLSFARGTAAALGILGLTVSVRGILHPAEASTTFGFPPGSWSATHASRNPWIKIASGRTLSGALGTLALIYFKFDRALGVLLCTGAATALVDGWTVMNDAVDGSTETAPTAEEQEKTAKEQKAKALGHIGVVPITFVIGLYLFSHGDL